MTDAAAANLDKIIHRINSLLLKSESTEFPEESKALKAKAKQLVDLYRIDQENMIAVDQKSVSPILKTLPIARWNSPYRDWMWTLMLHVADHCEVLIKFDWEKNEHGEIYAIARSVGYDIDLRYAELLWSSIRLTFITKLEPEVDRSLSDEENIYRLRSSGLARKDVAEMLWGNWTHSNSAKVGKVYKAECAKRGEAPALDGKGIYLKTFREAYVSTFTWEVVDRLRMAADGALGQGGAMVFADRKDRVQEAFYKHFPEQRPKPVEEVIVVDPPTETAKKARKRMAVTETKAYKRKMEQKYNSAAARAGATVGASAAAEVNISRVAARTERLGYEGPAADSPSDQKEVGA